ncbi:DEAD-domain-containing protein [Aureobasidium sp. EXF-12298]|nr:DEAD-domain-containing protein [Aureobasidium sp. EXF-12298]KAI4764606.1 DEAD-domain-containing protein [Aureobasidium sp. EXF-12344]KAI4782184.1 DEAD-domain-containing protein [Aureobasidium sp. EXF-3400]
MGKREREEAAATVDAEVHKKAKKEKKEKSEDAEKAARKAARKAAKAQKKSEGTSGETDADEAKAEAKRLKKAAKAAAKPESTTSSTTSSDAVAAPVAATDGYTEHPGLTALPQSEIDAFIAEKFITVTDEAKASPAYRPITSFDYVPITDKAQRAPFANFKTPSPIQAAAWPYLYAGRDVIGVAETGSGKTMGFGVPCARYISSLSAKEQKKGIKACIVSPTRELAVQIQEQLVKLAEPAGLKTVCVYGGVNKDQQRATLTGAHIVVATPGRLNDFVSEGSIDLSNVTYAVLDEADRMLDKGFEEEVRKILGSCAPTGRQTLMFTATWPPSVRELAATFMKKPVRINIGENTTGELRANTRIVQEVEVMDPYDKNDRLIALLKKYQSGKNKDDRILVFCLYKKEATRIEGFIRSKGFNVGGIHGDLSQDQRQRSLDAFKAGKVPLLVATDVAARGLDIPAVKVVINVTFPLTVEDYVHRIGRTGRAGQDGRAITFFTDHEKGLAGALINVLKGANQPVPESLMKFGTTVKKKTHDAYGAFYRDPGEMKAATKVTFDD